MSIFHRPNLQFHAPRDIAEPMRPLIARLLADNADGFTYRCAIRHWEWSERPVAERFIGHRNVLRIDGPQFDIDGHKFPMGGMINGPGGWAKLDPIETKELMVDLRGEIDVTISRWLFKHRSNQLPIGCRPEIDRSIEDAQAIAEMIAWTRREREIETLHVS